MRDKIDQWISVADRLPEGGGFYITYNGNMVGLACFSTDDNTWDEYVTPKDWPPIYWMPLPPPPQSLTARKGA